MTAESVKRASRPAAWQRRLSLPGALTLLLACCGCPFSPQTGGDGLPVLDDAANSTFARATALPLANTDQMEFQGSIGPQADLDLFSLGDLNPGDRLYVDVQADTQGLDLVAAIFDSRQYLHAYNDDRKPDASDLNPLLDIVIFGEADTYYLGIAPYAGTTTTGTYHVTVRITRGGVVPPGKGQIVYLDWAGGQNIVVPNVGTFNLPPFDAGDLGPYGDRTAEMKDRVQATVAARYAGFNLIVQNSDDNPVPAQPHSTVYFGGTHPQAFAISEQIDTQNVDLSDSSMVFTGSFRDAFLVTPTFDQMATALGDTVAHEVGHLLGLVHTSDCDDLMDSSCANERLLEPQQFKTAELDASVFPVGFQPSRDILDWVLGLAGA